MPNKKKNNNNGFTKEDRDNLKYILSMQIRGDDIFDDWLSSMPEEDLEYALELLKNFVDARSTFVSSAC
jgi:hypothetical protein